MAIALQADNTLARGYINVNGQTAATFTTTQLIANLGPNTVSESALLNNSVTTDKIANNSITRAKLDSIGQGAGNPPIYGCRAWVRFNGTVPVSIASSGNVSSVTRTSLGNYTISFTTAMPDTLYCAVGSHNAAGSGYASSTSTVRAGSDAIQVLVTCGVATANFDPSGVSVAVFR